MHPISVEQAAWLWAFSIVGFGSKERRGSGFLVFCLRGKWSESQNSPPSFTRSIFRAAILCSRIPTKRLPRKLNFYWEFLLGISFKKSAFHLSQSSLQGSRGRPGRLKDRERYGTGDKDEKSVNGPTGLPFQEFCLFRKISSGKSCFIYIPTGISGIVWWNKTLCCSLAHEIPAADAGRFESCICRKLIGG